MTCKMFAVAVMTLSLGSTSVLAQTAGTTGGTSTTTGTASDTMGDLHDEMPMEWEGDIADAFYTDTLLGVLRDEEEMRTGWQDLGEDDRETVRDFCDRFIEDDTAMGATTTGAATGTATGADAGDPAAGTHRASLRQICAMVENDTSG